MTGWAVDSSLAADLTVMGRSVAYHMGVQQYKVEVPRSAPPGATLLQIGASKLLRDSIDDLNLVSSQY